MTVAGAVIGRETVGNSQDLFRYLTGVLRDRVNECFLVVYLDAKNRVIDMETNDVSRIGLQDSRG